MKRERDVVDARQRKIIDILIETPHIAFEDIAKDLEISMVTLRRDLKALEEQKLIDRFYGGARVLTNEQKLVAVSEERTAIAKAAASYVEDGDTIFINTSRNALEMLKYITSSNVTVITNNGKAIGMDLSDRISVIITGGELRLPKYAMVGDFAVNNLQNVNAKKAFLGCSGISDSAGITTEIASEVMINQLMCSHAVQGTYILADHTKVGVNSSFTSLGIDKIDYLITDRLASMSELDLIREQGVDIRVV